MPEVKRENTDSRFLITMVSHRSGVAVRRFLKMDQKKRPYKWVTGYKNATWMKSKQAAMKLADEIQTSLELGVPTGLMTEDAMKIFDKLPDGRYGPVELRVITLLVVETKYEDVFDHHPNLVTTPTA